MHTQLRACIWAAKLRTRTLHHKVSDTAQKPFISTWFTAPLSLPRKEDAKKHTHTTCYDYFRASREARRFRAKYPAGNCFSLFRTRIFCCFFPSSISLELNLLCTSSDVLVSLVSVESAAILSSRAIMGDTRSRESSVSNADEVEEELAWKHKLLVLVLVRVILHLFSQILPSKFNVPWLYPNCTLILPNIYSGIILVLLWFYPTVVH